MGLLHKPAVMIYRCLNRNKKLVKEQVKSDLEHLTPGGDREKMCEQFYVGKLEKAMLICLAGFVLAGVLTIRAGGGSEGYALARGDATDEKRRVSLDGTYNGKKEEFTIDILPVELTEGEAQEQYEEFVRTLPMLICGKNLSCQDVTSDLELLENYEGYPFWIEWKSMDTEVVTSSGKITRSQSDEEALLMAEISYGEWEWDTKLSVTVKAVELSPEERTHKEIFDALLAAESGSRLEKYVTLPAQVGEYAVKWQVSGDGPKLWWWMAAFVAGLAVYIMADHDLHSDTEKQRKQMKSAYPEIVHKLTLYLGAGMTLQGAFGMIGTEYERKKRKRKNMSEKRGDRAEKQNDEDAIYEQILYTCRELKSGVSEMQAYERFGRRTGLQEYIRLSTLMTQNLRKGNASLLSRLREEAQRALTEKVQRGRMLGEQASTKLLVPMVMMLGVVMVMVIIPAFGSIG